MSWRRFSTTDTSRRGRRHDSRFKTLARRGKKTRAPEAETLMAQDDLKALQRDLENLKAFRSVLLEIARQADTRIAARAIGTYMRLGPKTDEKNRGSTLRIQSGRLPRAVRGGIDRESSTQVSFDGSSLSYRRVIDVPYAAIHEFGGTITVRITDKMRRFFWAKFRETRDEKYKWMALARRQTFTIRIPRFGGRAPSSGQEAAGGDSRPHEAD